MPTIFETQSVFTILDKATPVLDSLAKKMEGLTDLAKTLQTSLSAISTINVEMGDTFSSVNRRMTSAIGRMERLTTATRQYQSVAETAAASTAALAGSMVVGSRGGRASAAVATGGGRGGKSSFHGVVGKLTSIPAMVAEYAAYMGINKAANIEDAINRAMVAMNVPVGADYMSTPLAQSIQNSILQASQRWGRPINDTSNAAMDIVRLLAPRSKEERMALLPSLLDFAGAETRGKPGTTMDEAAGVAIALAHQLRNYSPAQIEPVLKQFAQLSMATHSSLTQFARASSYYLPLLNAGLGMDAGKLMAIGTVGSQMGLNTKSGTWLAQLFTSPMTADLTGKRSSARRQALMKLGLMDKAGHLIHVTDPLDFLSTVGEHAEALSPRERIVAERAAFGQQGARGASIFTDKAVLKNIVDLVAAFKNAPSVSALHKAYQQSPLTQLQQQEQAFNTQLTKLGEHILPLATDAVRGFVMAIEGISVIAHALSPKTIGGWLDQKAPWIGDSLLRFHDWLAGHHDGVAPPPNRNSVTVHTQVNIDGRKVAKAVSKHQYDSANVPPASGSSFDRRMTPAYSGFVVGW